jgi:ABC-type branched-subunit amino acid transport system substrate-binding protein
MTTGFQRVGRVLAAAVAAAVLLAACGGESAGPATVKTDFGVTGKTIKLGMLTPLTGGAAAVGKPLSSGHEVFWKSVNATGGVGGYTVELVTKDTEYKPDVAVQQYNGINKDILIMEQVLGSQITSAVKDLSTADKMLMLPASLSSSFARDKYLVLLAAPYRIQVENGFEYVVKKLGKTNPKTFIIYQNDEYGLDGLRGYEESIPIYGLNDLGRATFKSGDTAFAAQVTEAKTKGAEYVVVVALSETARILGTAAALGFKTKWLLVSPAWYTAFKGLPVMKTFEDDATLFSDTAEWGDVTKPGMKEMLDNIQKYAPDTKPDGFFEFGYAQAKVSYAILKKAIENKDLTRAGMLKAFESLKNVDLGGLYPAPTYGSIDNPNKRVPGRSSRAWKFDRTAATGTLPITELFVGEAASKSQF